MGRPQAVRHMLGLPEGQRAFAGGDAESFHHGQASLSK
jgi:hypothetical protein